MTVCAFLFIFQFFSNSCLWIPFWIVFTAEFIPKVKNTIDSKKCAHAQALLYYVHIETFFSLVSFLNSFCCQIHSHGHKNNLKQKLCARASTLGHLHMCIFVHIWTFFQTVVYGYHFEEFLLENSFPWSKIQLIAKSARMHSTFRHFLKLAVKNTIFE